MLVARGVNDGFVWRIGNGVQHAAGDPGALRRAGNVAQDALGALFIVCGILCRRHFHLVRVQRPGMEFRGDGQADDLGTQRTVVRWAR